MFFILYYLEIYHICIKHINYKHTALWKSVGPSPKGQEIKSEYFISVIIMFIFRASICSFCQLAMSLIVLCSLVMFQACLFIFKNIVSIVVLC